MLLVDKGAIDGVWRTFKTTPSGESAARFLIRRISSREGEAISERRNKLLKESPEDVSGALKDLRVDIASAALVDSKDCEIPEPCATFVPELVGKLEARDGAVRLDGCWTTEVKQAVLRELLRGPGSLTAWLEDEAGKFDAKAKAEDAAQGKT